MPPKRIFKKAINHIYRKLYLDNDFYISELRNMGIVIGEDCTFYNPDKMTVDTSAPHLLTIGNSVKITGPSTILTHDYSWSVVKGLNGEILGNQKSVKIGNNVFIGWGATILCGTTIEDNTIIGAHAVVSGHVTGNSVWGGVPARRLCSLEEYRQKRQSVQVKEATEFVRAFKERFGRDPIPEEIPQYFFLFANPTSLNPVFEAQMRLKGTWEKSLECLATPRPFPSFEDFLKACE